MSVVCPVERVRPERAVAAKADDGELKASQQKLATLKAELARKGEQQ